MSNAPVFLIPSPLHKLAANAVESFCKRQSSLQNLTLSSPRVPSTLKKATFALSLNVLKYLHVIDHIRKHIHLKSDKLSFHLVNVLIYDITMGELVPQHESSATALKCSPPAANIWNQRRTMSSVLENYMLANGAKSFEDLLPDSIKNDCKFTSSSRYVRINGLRGLSPMELCQEFNATPDPLVPGLLLLPQSFGDLFSHPRVVSGDVMVQDKSSCLPVVALKLPPNAVVLDACSAPGSKTTMIIGLSNRPARVIAVEKDAKRFSLLENNLVKFLNGDENVTVDLVPASFLDIDPEDDPFSTVEYILVDAQCSGSGSTKVNADASLGQHVSTVYSSKQSKRPTFSSTKLAQLSETQIEMVSHALSFPSVKRVVYSTCSVFSQENEQVVATILMRHFGWKLETVIPEWPTRGDVSHGEMMRKCLRCDVTSEHGGFFVASFVRK
ncbi:hypothetical protein RCL1_004898 [Eukaryota sp. TZLM3-RCL]